MILGQPTVGCDRTFFQQGVQNVEENWTQFLSGGFGEHLHVCDRSREINQVHPWQGDSVEGHVRQNQIGGDKIEEVSFGQ